MDTAQTARPNPTRATSTQIARGGGRSGSIAGARGSYAGGRDLARGDGRVIPGDADRAAAAFREFVRLSPEDPRAAEVRDPDRYNPVVQPEAEPLAADTPMAVERVLLERLRGLSPAQKADMVSAMSRTAQAMSLAGLRRRYPAAAPDELRLRLAALRLPRETMVRVFGWDPAIRGY